MRIDPVDCPPDWEARRKAVLKRDGFKCCNCDSLEDLEVHHMRPVSDGGTHHLNNLQTLCRKCHSWMHPHLLAKAALERGLHRDPRFLKWQQQQYERDRRLRGSGATSSAWRSTQWFSRRRRVGVRLPWRATLVKILFWVLVLALGAFCVYSLLR